MAKFSKLSSVLVLAGLFVSFASLVQAVPYVSSDVLKTHSVAKPKSEIIVVEYNNKGEVVDFVILNDANTSAAFSLFPFVTQYGRGFDQNFDTGIVLSVGESLDFRVVDPLDVDTIAGFPSVFSLMSDQDNRRLYLYLFLQVLWFDLRSRVPSMQLVDTGEKVFFPNLPKNNQTRGRRDGGFVQRMM